MKNLSEQKFSEMIYAFSAGCLDKEEYLEFLEYLRSGRKMPENELGELQNVISLLPAMLELEEPNVRVKDKVAKRLYRMREELRAKKRESLKEPPAGEVRPSNENVFAEKLIESQAARQAEIQAASQAQAERKEASTLKTTGRMTVESPAFGNSALEEDPSKKRAGGTRTSTIVEAPHNETESADYQKETPAVETPGSMNKGAYTLRTMAPVLKDQARENPVMEEPQKDTPPKERFVQEETEEEELQSGRSWKSILFMAAVLVFVIIAGAIVYVLMNQEIHQDKSQIASLSGQVNALNSEMLRLDRNQKVLAVLSARDLKTINLDGTASNAGGFGKLTLLQDGKEGVIQFYNMPPLKQNEVYQLWLLSKGIYYSLGTFRTKREVEYFPFSNPEIDQNSIDSYTVTLEDGEGKTSPSEKVYLMTTLNAK